MSQQLSDYLTQEASDYLDQLEVLLTASGRPDINELVRLTRGVRGSAEMGGLETIALVAKRLDEAGNSLISGSSIWSEELRQLALQTVRDLKILIGALSRWGPDEEARVRSAIVRWEEGATGDSGEIVPISTLFPDDPGPHVVAGNAGPEGEVVSIAALLFRGEAALKEAIKLRPDVERIAHGGSPGEIASILNELFDLIDLGSRTGPQT